jgi:hypothetical protein
MSEGPVIPPGTGIDTSVPHSARIWNYWLGGKDNYEADRIAGDAWVNTDPSILDLARCTRALLGRVVRTLAVDYGVRQFLDIGTGLPTADNTHEVAQRVAPDARVVYVDNDPLVLAHARALLGGTPEGKTRYMHGDVRDADDILRGAAGILDFTEPIAVLMFGLLGHITKTTEARALVEQFMAPMPPGSYLAIADGTPTEQSRKAEEEQIKKTGVIPYRNREPEKIASFFEGLEWVEPGFVSVSLWRPDRPPAVVPTIASTAPQPVDEYGGLARKP